MTDNTTTAAEELAREIGAEFVQSKRYGRLVLDGRTLVYVNPTHLDFKADHIAQAPKADRDKLVTKGDRAHLPITETKAATALLKNVAAKGAK